MCTGMKEWLEDVRSEGETIGFNNGIETTCNIISEFNNNTPITVIASKYNVDENQISMIMHVIKPQN